MATLDKKISEFTATASLSDTSQAFLALVDETESVASNRNKKMTVDNFKTALNIQGGMSANEKANQNNLIKDVARLNYANSLNAIDYKGGSYDIFADSAKIASSSQVVVSTLDGGDPNGKVELEGEQIGYRINNSSYSSNSFATSTQDSNPVDVYFKSDGTKMYLLGATDNIFQYSLSTAWDLSTITYDSVSFSVSSQDTQPQGITFKSDGTKMYVVGIVTDSVYEYTLSTAWDVSTASYSSNSLSVSGQDSIPFAVDISSDGTKVYIAGLNNIVYQYTLPTAYSLSGASYSGVSFSVSAQSTSTYGCRVSPDGLKLLILSEANDTVYQYTMSVANVISSATYDSVSFNTTTQDARMRGISFSGLNMYLVGTDTNPSIYQYSSSVSGGVFFTSGNFVTTTIDLTADLASNPTSVVVSSEFVTPTDTTLSVVISDGTPANDVTVTSANFDTEVDCSSLTSRTLTLTWNLGTSNTSATPTLNNYGVYFT